MAARDVRDTKVYQKAFALAMKIFTVSKTFPKEEIYSLTGQIRKSSRSVCVCLGEAYRKKRYPSHFVAKISDCDMENSETGIWLDFSLSCEYINRETHKNFKRKMKKLAEC